MTRLVKLALVTATLTLACGASSASWRIHRRVPSFSAVWNLSVGSAAVYDVQSERGKSTVELAVVGNEPKYHSGKCLPFHPATRHKNNRSGSYYADGNSTTVDAVGVTYDALDLSGEQNRSGPVRQSERSGPAFLFPHEF